MHHSSFVVAIKINKLDSTKLKQSLRYIRKCVKVFSLTSLFSIFSQSFPSIVTALICGSPNSKLNQLILVLLETSQTCLGKHRRHYRFHRKQNRCLSVH